jgi:hypothetical protein
MLASAVHFFLSRSTLVEAAKERELLSCTLTTGRELVAMAARRTHKWGI